MCVPYFVNLNNNTFQLKTLLFFVHLRSQQKRKEESHLQLSNLQCCHFDIVILRVAIISNVQNAFSVDTGRQTTPPLVDGVVHARLVRFAPHGKAHT